MHNYLHKLVDVFVLVLGLTIIGCSNSDRESWRHLQNVAADTINFPAPVVVNQPPTATSTPELIALATDVIKELSGCEVKTPPDPLNTKGRFFKYCDANGIPVLAFEDVSDLAVQQAHYVLLTMLRPIPDYKEILVNNQVKLVVYNNHTHTLADILQMLEIHQTVSSGYYGIFDPASEMVITWQSDVLCEPGWGYDQFTIHELAHALEVHIIREDEDLRNELRRAYDIALAQKDRWDETAAMFSSSEYWAYGVSVYFNVGWEDESARPVNRIELEKDHPALFEFIDDFFRGFQWTPICP